MINKKIIRRISIISTLVLVLMIPFTNMSVTAETSHELVDIEKELKQEEIVEVLSLETDVERAIVPYQAESELLEELESEKHLESEIASGLLYGESRGVLNPEFTINGVNFIDSRNYHNSVTNPNSNWWNAGTGGMVLGDFRKFTILQWFETLFHGGMLERYGDNINFYKGIEERSMVITIPNPALRTWMRGTFLPKYAEHLPEGMSMWREDTMFPQTTGIHMQLRPNTMTGLFSAFNPFVRAVINDSTAHLSAMWVVEKVEIELEDMGGNRIGVISLDTIDEWIETLTITINLEEHVQVSDLSRNAYRVSRISGRMNGDGEIQTEQYVPITGWTMPNTHFLHNPGGVPFNPSSPVDLNFAKRIVDRLELQRLFSNPGYEFYGNGGSFLDEAVKKIIEVEVGTMGTPLTEEINIPKRVGYTFLYWTEDSEGEGNRYFTEELTGPLLVNTFLPQNRIMPLPMYAQWLRNTYKVTFDANGGDEIGEVRDVLYDAHLGLLPEPVREGYQFLGWYNGINEDADRVEATDRMPAHDLNLVAHWEQITYNITFNPTEGNFEIPGIITQIVAHGMGLTEEQMPPIPVRANHLFLGWFTELTEEGLAGINLEEAVFEEDTELFAKWLQLSELILEVTLTPNIRFVPAGAESMGLELEWTLVIKNGTEETIPSGALFLRDVTDMDLVGAGKIQIEGSTQVIYPDELVDITENAIWQEPNSLWMNSVLAPEEEYIIRFTTNLEEGQSFEPNKVYPKDISVSLGTQENRYIASSWIRGRDVDSQQFDSVNYGLVNIPNSFNFKEIPIDSRRMQEIDLHQASYTQYTQDNGLYLRIADSGQPDVLWDVTVSMSELCSGTGESVDRLLGAKLRIQPELMSFVDAFNTPQEEQILLASEQTPLINEVIVDTEAALIVQKGGGMATGVWNLSIPLNNIKLLIPANVGQVDTSYSGVVTWTLSDAP